MSAPFDPAAHREAMAQSLGLTIRPEWQDGVDGFLAVAARMAQLLEEAPHQENEAAAVYRPGAP